MSTATAVRRPPNVVSCLSRCESWSWRGAPTAPSRNPAGVSDVRWTKPARDVRATMTAVLPSVSMVPPKPHPQVLTITARPVPPDAGLTVLVSFKQPLTIIGLDGEFDIRRALADAPPFPGDGSGG